MQIPYAYLDSYIDDYGQIRFRECYETEHGSRKYEQMKSLLKSIAHIYRKRARAMSFGLWQSERIPIYFVYKLFVQRDECGKESRQIARLKDVLRYVAKTIRSQ